MIFPYWAGMYDARRNRKAADVALKVLSADPGFPHAVDRTTLATLARELLAIYLEAPPAVRVEPLEESDVPATIDLYEGEGVASLRSREGYYLIRCPTTGFVSVIEFLHEVGHLLQDQGQGLTRPLYVPRFPRAYQEACEVEATAWAYTVLALAFPEEFEKQARMGLLHRPFVPFMPPLDYTFGGVFPRRFGPEGYFFHKKGGLYEGANGGPLSGPCERARLRAAGGSEVCGRSARRKPRSGRRPR